MLYDNLPIALPWYNGISKQDRFRWNAKQGTVICQIAPNNGLLPFQLKKPTTSAFPISWTIRCMQHQPLEWYDSNDDPIIADLSAFTVSALIGETFDGNDYITFRNFKNALNIITGSTLGTVLPTGIYYMRMDFEDPTLDIWVSELFRVPEDAFAWNAPDTVNYLTFKWRHDSDIKPIHYDNDPLDGDGNIQGFYNLLYLDTTLTASEPTMEVTGQKDGKDELIPTFMKAIIKYRVSAVIPDYLKVALHLMQMHNFKYVATEQAIRQGFVKNMDVTSTLTTDGAHSIVEVLFEQMILLSDTVCSDNMTPPDPFILMDDPIHLDITGCPDTGEFDVRCTGAGVPLPDGIYGELWGAIGGGAYSLIYVHIDTAALVPGWAHVSCGIFAAGMDHFKIVFRTFSFDVGLETSSFTLALTC